MKKIFFFAASTLALASCSTEGLVDDWFGGEKSNVISFNMNQKNMVRSTQDMQKVGHYNFGVFGYKSTDKVNNIMADYLVGYYDVTNGYGTQTGSTFGDQNGIADGESYWMYEGMGSAEYNGTYAGETVNPGTKFASNVANQYLRYWDKSADYTCFYAYAPYINNTATGKTVTYVDGQEVGTSTDKYVMTIPNGTIKHGYDKADEFEFMYAWTKVVTANYGHDVPLNFHRLNAKVNIKFWEDIPGYSVRIIDLNPTYSVSAVPSIKDNTSGKYGYKLGKIYSENGAKIQFYPENATPTDPTLKQYEGTTVDTPIKFDAPTAAQIGESRLEATPSTTTYYAIPKGSPNAVLANGADKFTDAGTLNTDLAETGLTFHVSYELISTTGEVITVKDATVHVTKDYANWEANKHYTYIFKITKNSNGTTEPTVVPKPEDPEVTTESALYPIVFDNCTVEDWETSESEWQISDAAALSYHNITLGQYSLVNGDVTVLIANDDKNLTHSVDYEKYVAGSHESGISVSGPDAADENDWYDASTKKITVPTGATAGVYTVTYTCPDADVYANHPKTWTAKFVVGNTYTVSTNLNEVGTHGLAASALSISATKDAAAITPAATELSIEYPVNLSDAEKALVKVSSDGTKVEVANTAAPGKYKLVYTITVDGSKVKVAEKPFEVKDYQFILSTYAVKLGASPVVINATCPGTGVLSMTSATGITVDDATKKISVANTASEGTYTVTYTVQGSTVSEVKYQKTFTVANQYSVALSKNTLKTTVGAANAAEYGSDYIEVTSTKNQVADAVSAELAAKYTIEGLAAADYKFFVDGTVIKLQVKKSVNAGTYTVVYTGQTGKTATAQFVIQK